MKNKFFLIFASWIFALHSDALDEFISLRTFRSISDHTPGLPQEFNPCLLKAGDIFYLRSSHSAFFQQVHPQIRVPYILITHGNPCEFPGLFESYLDDPQLILWFAQNLPKQHHPKIQPIPLGISPNLKNAEILKLESKKEKKKFILLYVNFSTETCPSEREPLLERFSKERYCTVKGRVSFEEYLQDLGASYFVLCPQGVALDSFRTWESLYMGAIPIVKSSSLDPIFQDLPVLIVQDWNEIHESFLQEMLQEMSSKTYLFEKLCPKYWFEYISSFSYKK